MTYEGATSAGWRTGAASVVAAGAGRGDVTAFTGGAGEEARGGDEVDAGGLEVTAAGATSTGGVEVGATLPAGLSFVDAGAVVGSWAGAPIGTVAVVIAGARTSFSKVDSDAGASACSEVAASAAGGEMGGTLAVVTAGTTDVAAAAAPPRAAAAPAGTPTAPSACTIAASPAASPTPDMVRVLSIRCCFATCDRGLSQA